MRMASSKSSESRLFCKSECEMTKKDTRDECNFCKSVWLSPVMWGKMCRLTVSTLGKTRMAAILRSMSNTFFSPPIRDSDAYPSTRKLQFFNNDFWRNVGCVPGGVQESVISHCFYHSSSLVKDVPWARVSPNCLPLRWLWKKREHFCLIALNLDKTRRSSLDGSLTWRRGEWKIDRTVSLFHQAIGASCSKEVWKLRFLYALWLSVEWD